MQVLFMGTPDYAKEILEKLISEEMIEVVGVYTQPDKPVGRKKILTPPPVKVLAQKENIPLYQPTRLRDKETIDEVCSIKCDFIVVAAYGQILPKEILEHAPCINLHASILPKYRGASPIQQAILEGETQTGVTAMLMDEGLDTGDIIKIQTCPIAPDEMVSELYEKLTKIAAELTIDVVKNFSSYTPKPQDDTQATYCKKITKKDGEIIFDDAKKVFNRYRAFTPWPGIFLPSGLKLKEIGFISENGTFPAGEIIKIEQDHIVVGCEKGQLKIIRVQSPSKKETDILSYLNGQRLSVGTILS
ncbi:MAG: methionyl-tRNA formyltransferase [Epsilonproteobacteria bacterium]|nr:methionyl-tRNA formyltransferase [Campylobacterota bacterium]